MLVVIVVVVIVVVVVIIPIEASFRWDASDTRNASGKY